MTSVKQYVDRINALDPNSEDPEIRELLGHAHAVLAEVHGSYLDGATLRSLPNGGNAKEWADLVLSESEESELQCAYRTLRRATSRRRDCFWIPESCEKYSIQFAWNTAWHRYEVLWSSGKDVSPAQNLMDTINRIMLKRGKRLVGRVGVEVPALLPAQEPYIPYMVG